MQDEPRRIAAAIGHQPLRKEARSQEARRLLRVAVGTATFVGGAFTAIAAGWLHGHFDATGQPLELWFVVACFSIGGILSGGAVESAFPAAESDAATRAEQLSTSPQLRQEVFAELDKPITDGSVKFWPLLLISLGIFVVSGQLAGGLTDVVLLAAVLAFHEAGHLVAMQAFGYRDTQLLFLPFFGALATGTPARVSVRQQAIVLLAGPVPGLLLGAALLWSPFAVEPLVGNAANMLLWINAFNLLPLGILDGGKLLSLLLSRWPRLEASFIVTSSTLLAIIALGLQAWILLVVAIVCARAAPRAYRVSKSARALGARMTFPPSLAAASDAFRQELFDEAYFNVLRIGAFRSTFKRNLPAACAFAMRRVHAHGLQRYAP